MSLLHILWRRQQRLLLILQPRRDLDNQLRRNLNHSILLRIRPFRGTRFLGGLGFFWSIRKVWFILICLRIRTNLGLYRTCLYLWGGGICCNQRIMFLDLFFFRGDLRFRSRGLWIRNVSF